MAQQPLCMRSQANRFQAPVAQAVKRADSDPPKTRSVGPLRCLQTPIKISLRSRGVHLPINRAIVRFLVHHKAIRTFTHQRNVILSFEWPNLQGNARELSMQPAHAIL